MLAQALPHAVALEELDLSSNALTDESARQLAERLSQRTHDPPPLKRLLLDRYP